MSLVVWLPLTKDLRQQGLANTSTITLASGNAFVDGGKVGNKALHLTKQQTILGTSSCMSGKKQMSYAFWVKVNTAWSAQWLDGIAWNSTDGSSAAYSRQEFYTNCTRIGTWFSGSSLSGYVFTPGEWTHIAGTFDYTAGIAKFYINGVLQGTSTSLSKTHYCRGDFYIGDNGVDIVENDVRIYDHCLSPMEVKELAKGLVLHYPLNRQGWGQENLVWNSNWNVHSTTPPESWVNWGSPPTREIVTIDGKNWLHVISNTTQFQGYSQNWTKRNGVGELTANTKMTVSFTAKLATAASIAPIGIHWCNSSGTIVTQNWTTTALTTSPKRYSFTYTTPADCVAFNIMVGDNTNTAHEVWVTDIKLEFGEIATPWCPNSSDALATTMGLNSTTEYDCSGFCNNGTRTGTFTWTSDTPKYAVNTEFAGDKTIYIQMPTITLDWSKVSFAAWGRWDAFNTWSRIFDFGNGVNGADWDICLANHSTNANPGLGGRTGGGASWPDTKVTEVTLTAGQWYHFVETIEGTTCKLYVNGELKKTITLTNSPTITTMNRNYLGLSNWSSNGAFKGGISDFRLYTTVLSADDVKSLYQNSAYIDSSGNVYGAVHTEV